MFECCDQSTFSLMTYQLRHSKHVAIKCTLPSTRIKLPSGFENHGLVLQPCSFELRMFLLRGPPVYMECFALQISSLGMVSFFVTDRSAGSMLMIAV